jgi:hypothetical protein
LRAHVFGRDQRGRVQDVFLHPDVMLQALRQEGVFGMAFRPRFGAQQLQRAHDVNVFAFQVRKRRAELTGQRQQLGHPWFDRTVPEHG